MITPAPSSVYTRDVFGLLGVPMDKVDLAGAAKIMTHAANDQRRLWVSTVNLDWMVMAAEDPTFRATILRSDLVTCDGAPLLRLAGLMGVKLPGRVTGADLFETLRASPTSPPLRTYFFGGRDDAAEAAAARLRKDGGPTSGLTPCGFTNPGFGDLDTLSQSDLLAGINDEAPDFLVVALGAKKGQFWLDRNRTALNAKVIAHFGAVVDFTAGGIARAPKLAQSLNLEWAWRIGQDPALWRRYAKDARYLPTFMQKALGVRTALKRLAQIQTVPGRLEMTSAHRWHIRGDMRGPALAELRQALTDLNHDHCDLIIDFAPETIIDLESVGLLLRAQQHLTDHQGSLALTATDPSLRTLYHLNHLPVSSALMERSQTQDEPRESQRISV